MANAKIYIFGEIGTDTTLRSVVEQYKSVKSDTIDVFINSNGGSVDEGFAIYDFLQSLKLNGIEVNGHVNGFCASIATIIFLACDNRVVTENSKLLIHNPSVTANGTKKDFLQYAKELELYENEIIEFYKKHLNLSMSQIVDYMNAERIITADEAIKIGFAKEILQQKVRNVMNFIKLFKKEPIKNISVDTASGLVESASESFAEGVEVTLNGESGLSFEFELDGKVYVVEGGIIMSISDVQMIDEEPVEVQNEALTKEQVSEMINSALETAFASKLQNIDNNFEEVSTAIKAIGEKIEMYAKITKSPVLNIKEETTFKAQEKEAKLTPVQQYLTQIKNKK